ncbi:MAG TPA: tetratricopeptide repeat protein, partial [Tenuifilaceae bacterium]|nr:tetratricopeptide repeat protein [Tenuifilaceae bacterium]
MTKLRAFILSLTLAAAFSLAHGQETSISTREEALFAKAFELYQKGLYASSQKTFQKFLSEYSSDVVAQLRTDAEFYSAICAIELNNNDAEYLLGRFIQNHPESQYIDLAYFVMGKRQYQQKNFTSSIYWLSMIDGEGLDREKRYEMQFMLGYCYFMTNDFDLPALSIAELYR